jgi:GAF domain-containing protein/HAMP domain-containing protein
VVGRIKHLALHLASPAQRGIQLAVLTALASLTLSIVYALLARSTAAWQWTVLAIWTLLGGLASALLVIAMRRQRGAPSLRGLYLIWWLGSLIHSALVADLGLYMAALNVTAMVATWPETRPRHAARAALVVGGLLGGAILLEWFTPLRYRVALPDSVTMLLPWGIYLLLLAGALLALKRFYPNTIWAKITIAFLLVALVPVWLLAFVNDSANRAALLTDAQRELSATSRQTATQIDVFINTHLDDMRTEAQLPDFARVLSPPPDQRVEDASRTDAIDNLRAFSRASSDIRSYALLDVNGRDVLDTDVQEQGGDESSQDYFWMPFREGLPYASPIHIDQARGNAYIYFSGLVHSPAGTPIGVLRVRYNADVLQQIILQSNNILGDGSFALLLDENHVILADGLAPQRILQPVVPLDPAHTRELQRANRLLVQAPADPPLDWAAFAQALTHADTQPFFSAALTPNASDSSEQEEIALVRLKTQPWLVAFVEPQAIFDLPLAAQARSELLLGIAILVVAAIAAVSFAKQLANPIMDLTVVANRVVAGDRSPRVAVETSDEIGQLAAAFQAMIGAVETREAELKTHAAELELLNALGRGIAATLNLKEVAERAVALVADRFKDCLTELFLYDQERAELVSYAAAGQGARSITPGERIPAGVGLLGRAAQTRETQIATGSACAPDSRSLPGLEVQAEAVSPILHERKLVGALSVASASPNAFRPRDLLLLETLAAQLAPAIENVHLFQETEHRLQHLRALREIDMSISNSLDLKLTLEVVLKQVVTELGVDAADVLLLNPATKILTYAAGLGFRSQALQHTKLALGEGLAGQAAFEGRLVSVPDLVEGANGLRRSPFLEGEGFSTYYGVPLLTKGQVKGVLEVFHRSTVERGPEWIEFLEALAGQAAIAVDNAELFEGLQRSNLELERAYDTTLEGWTRALDLRDKETEGHTLRVTEMTVRLARAMGLDDAELVHVRRGALLHDIGKIGIPDSILLKPGPLTDEEWKIMRMHPVYAYEMLAPIDYLQPALDIPHYHHEKWDGSGYPQGLKGEQIPLVARLFAIVDVWDALRSDRPYRNGWPEGKVRDYLREQSSKHFDPKVVETFLRMDASSRVTVAANK